MNDRFKFRTWWKPNYRKPIMLYDVEETYDFMRGEPESICADCFGEVLEDEDYIVMQCTGLKDKNGKLIYEGDVVKFKNFDNRYYIGTIKYTDEDALFCLSYINENKRQDWEYVSRFRLEVIGNIYENPVLLESEG